MRFSCGVTLYYPTVEELNHILNYSDSFSSIYLFDNTDDAELREKNKSFFEGKTQYTYLSEKKNIGLARAFNVMCQLAKSKNFQYICLFDQDSLILREDLESLFIYLRIESNSTLGIIAPEIIYQHKSKQSEQILNKEKRVKEIDWVISSGSFINLDAYQSIGGFDENYFIDRLDYDYCMSLRKKGYRIFVFEGVYLKQSLGDENGGHSAVRHYYMFRNRIYFYLIKNNFNLKNLFKVIFKSINHILVILFKERDSFKKIKMIIRALVDVKKGEMGKYS